MHKIIQSTTIAPDINLIVFEAPDIAKHRKPGQFVVLRLDEEGERIPLTIVESDPVIGTITLVVQGIGYSTRKINQLIAGEYVLDILGPLGKPSIIEDVGTIVVIGGGVGTGVAYPTAKAFKDAGNYTIGIVGARSKNMLVLEEEMKAICDECYATTDDGSYGFHGFVTQKLQVLLDQGVQIHAVLAVGPIPMMKAVAELTLKAGIPTTVSLNPIMIDGMGMCGGCRATVDNKTVFVCVDGPEFNAHKVDFDTLSRRNRAYQNQERSEILDPTHECKLTAQSSR
jgi:ferredoxin--NADP+ reductase